MLTAVADAAAASGDFDRAEVVAASITDLDWRADVLTAVGGNAAAVSGDFDRARQLAVQAEAMARAITAPDRQAQALTALARAVTIA